jgi:hypothetical protein
MKNSRCPSFCGAKRAQRFATVPRAVSGAASRPEGRRLGAYAIADERPCAGQPRYRLRAIVVGILPQERIRDVLAILDRINALAEAAGALLKRLCILAGVSCSVEAVLEAIEKEQPLTIRQGTNAHKPGLAVVLDQEVNG